jgi:hypothetical protein
MGEVVLGRFKEIKALTEGREVMALARERVRRVEVVAQVMRIIGGGAGIWPACGPERGTI